MDISVFLREYENGTLNVSDGIKYDVRKVIERNNRLKHGQFEHETFPDGTKKLFYNMAATVARTIYRNTDLDTKDMQIVSMNGKGIKMMPFLKMALRWYLKVVRFGNIINETRQEMIDMGHVILKHVDGQMKIVNLLNIVVPPHVDSIQESGCAEITFLTWDDMLKEKENWKDQWSLIEKIKEANDAAGEIYFTIIEYWTMGKLKEDNDEMGDKKICIKYIDTDIFNTSTVVKKPDNIQVHEELERFEAPDEWTDPFTDEVVNGFPYVERRFIKIKGRYIGFGVYELLSGLQEDYNERMNLKRRIDRQSLTGILVHRLPSDQNKAAALTQEFLSNVDQGAILDVESDEDLTRLNSQYIPDFIAMIDKLFEIMRLIVGVTSQGTGENLPGSTPATLGVINQQVAQTTYDVVIEEQSLLWEEVFNKFLLKNMLKKISKKKTIAITGDASIIDDMDAMYAENHLNAAIQQFQDTYGVPGIVKNGKTIYFETRDPMMYEQQYMMEKEALIQELRKQGDTRFSKLTDEMYSEIETSVQFYVNNEAFDKVSTVKDLMTFRQIPDLTVSKKKLDEYLLDLTANLDAKRFQKDDKEKAEEVAQRQQMAAAEMGNMPNQVDGMVENAPIQSPGQQFAGNNAL